MILQREFRFEAAHHLPSYHGKCEAVHGHSYRLRVSISGLPDSEGMILDFAEVKKIVTAKVLDKLDHNDLNKIIPNPTAENIAAWVWRELAEALPLHEIQIWETENCSAIFTIEDTRRLT
ncbi:MAG: 6-carboxytetrahydropterin synthase QueD [Candidatus Gracilibacteria bacterium]|jgi:6-pyruvoyltetrahydropterin/6-carboxytetrahydropterin synthase|nr:6-carboxytetrahydropterin synthase QueD [Candidatus Gracilibacteria bacterium]MDD5179387.1 6-carboxytetrahydropterin synthase QueD [Candidatus Gracilibacteria bacterium]